MHNLINAPIKVPMSDVSMDVSNPPLDAEKAEHEQIVEQQEEAVVGTTVGDEGTVAGPNISNEEDFDETTKENENDTSDEEDVR